MKMQKHQTEQLKARLKEVVELSNKALKELDKEIPNKLTLCNIVAEKLSDLIEESSSIILGDGFSNL